MNQHYVPRLYLKEFASKKGDEYYVDVYDRTKNSVFNTNIRNICAERNLYTLDSASKVDKDILAIEKFYSDYVEPMFQQACGLLTNDKLEHISENQRLTVLFGIFSLYSRNPIRLKYSIENYRKQINELYNFGLINDKLKITFQAEEFYIKDWSAEKILQYFIGKLTTEFKEKHLNDTRIMVDYHKDARFEVLKINDDSFLLTSDNPLVLEDLEKKDNYPLAKSKEFFLPLNPKYVLKIFHDNTKPLNRIQRYLIRGGNTGVINCSIEEQSFRFLIGTLSSFKEFFEMRARLEDTSFDKQIELAKQVLKIFPDNSETLEMKQTLVKYIQMYENNNKSLDLKTQEKMHRKIREISINVRNRRTK
jgi:hypothetical protein